MYYVLCYGIHVCVYCILYMLRVAVFYCVIYQDTYHKSIYIFRYFLDFSR